MQLKTSTKISLYFSIFTTIIFVFVIIFINIFTFRSWYNQETNEIKKDTEKMNTYTLEKHSDDAIKRKETIDNLETKLGVVLKTKIDKEYEFVWLNIYEKYDKYYLVYFHDSKFWLFALPYNITLTVYNQKTLLTISIILLILIFFISYIIAKFLFTKLALKNIYNISNQLKATKISNISYKSYINTDLKKDDEVYIIVKSINDFIRLIDKYTTNLKQFNSNVSHEFKTPLMIMLSEIEYSIETWKYKESYNKIESQINILNELLETFIFISKVVENKIKIIKKSTDINLILENKLIEIQEIYKDKNIKLNINIDKNTNIETDEKLLWIVLRNLIDNSFKYTQNSGTINIILKKEYFKIIDNGIWISKDKLNNIFNSFFREKEDNKWYGIWLNIVQKIIIILWFKINIKSIKWKWSEFTIRF